MRSFALISLLLSVSIALVICQDGSSSNDMRRKAFEVYLKMHNRTYVEEELLRRLELYWKRHLEIEESNKNFTEGRSTYSMRENNFMDFDEEQMKRLHGYRKPSQEQLDEWDSESDSDTPMLSNNGNLPQSIDWRDYGCINKPYDQGECGSCYATAVMGAIEGMHCIQQHTSPELSFQQIVDCATSSNGYSNFGCEGGSPPDSLKYLQNVQYAANSDCYPNRQDEGRCRFNRISSSQGCVTLASPSLMNKLRFRTLRSENEMMEALVNSGPIIVGMEASDHYMMYGDGIFNGDDCSNRMEDHNHAMVAVGYGSENGQDYWLLKNSYGESWGESGYIRMNRGSNTCGLGLMSWVVTA